jgi:selenocysteine lyase/cysteine desulfurase
MRQIYMNYAATSPRTSPAVTEGLESYLRQNRCLSAGRNFEGLDDGAVAFRARRAIGRLFGSDFPNRVIFTPGATFSLNMILNGVIRQGDHVIVSGVEHNAAMRPLELLRQKGIAEFDRMPCERDGTVDPACVGALVRGNTRALVMAHASNMLGTVLPWEGCFAEAKRCGIFTILDAAQTAGAYPLSLGKNIDALVFSGHKGLRGLAGIGGFVLGEASAEKIEPWL